jgi:hypothetical protein
MRLKIWSPEEAELELKRRLKNAKQFRMRYESAWEESERALFNTRGRDDVPDARYSFESDLDLGIGDVDSSNQTTGVNYLFRNFRYIHAQMSANPPTVMARPTSTDPSDRSKADAADRLVRHAIRAENMQEKIDLASAKCLLYGTGYMKAMFDPHQGDIVSRDEETGEFELEGKIDIYAPSTWDVWLDPDSRVWDDVRYVFEKKTMPLDEALFLFPEKEDILREASRKLHVQAGVEYADKAELDQEVVEIYEYWEKGLPINAMLGRFAYCLESGQLLSPMMENPYAFSPPADKEDVDERTGKVKRMPPTAYLPYHIFTDIDIPDEVYGKSFTEYESKIQEILDRLDSVTLDNVEAHGVARLVLPEGAEIAEDSITNSPWDIVKIKGTQPPFFQSVPTLMPDMTALRDRLKAGGDDLAGVNDSMFGQIQRETSGFSLQYATNQGNMIRRRLFNKYVMFVESIYKGYLNLVRKYWKEPKIIHVLGAERAFEAIDIKGADIDGGFDLVVEYGVSLSLDPTTRREELLQLMPLFEKAGIDNKTILSMLKLSELEGLYDINELSGQRQKEIFDEMLESNKYIAPRELEEHKGMLNYAYRFIMTAEFKYLPEDQKLLIEQHIKEREQVAAMGAGAGPTGPMTPGPNPMGPDAGAVPNPEAMMSAAAGGLPTEGPITEDEELA